MTPCTARLSLIVPGEDDPTYHSCEKRAGHRDYHGTLGGYSWHATPHDAP